MTFKKLVLAAAIASVPAVGFSVESLEDTDLGGVTGQDGIEVAIGLSSAGISTDIYLHDTDGISVGGTGTGSFGTGYSFDGAIVIDNMTIANGSANTITLLIDAGASAVSAGAPILNINVSIPTALTVSTGDIRVANSQIDDAVSARGVDSISGVILNSTSVVLGGTTLNIQLGNEQQNGSVAGTDMIVLNTSVTSGVYMTGFRLNDASGGGIGNSSITVTDAGGSNLTVAADINVIDGNSGGLQIGLGQLGSAGGISVEIVDQYLGSTGAGIIGDVSVVGLNLNGTTITISGK